MPGQLCIFKSIITVNYKKTDLKTKNHIIVSLDTEIRKGFRQNSTCFHGKSLRDSRTGRNTSQYENLIHDKSTANIIENVVNSKLSC